MSTLALLLITLACGLTAHAETFPILDAEAIDVTTQAYLAGRSPAVRTTPRPTVALTDALALLAHSDLPLPTGAEVITANGRLVTHALRNSVEQAMRKNLSWTEVRAFTAKSALNPDFEAILRNPDGPLAVEGAQTYTDLPRVVLDLERVSRNPKRSDLHAAANAALGEFYDTLAEVILVAARSSTGPYTSRAEEVVRQAMLWFEVSASPTSATALRTVATAPPSARTPQIAVAARAAGNLLITKAKRTAWDKLVLACAGILEEGH